MTIEVLTLTGAAFEAALDDVARLRIEVFRHWPYLYDGDMDYERRYLSRYCGSGGAVLVGAFDGARGAGPETGSRPCRLLFGDPARRSSRAPRRLPAA